MFFLLNIINIYCTIVYIINLWCIRIWPEIPVDPAAQGTPCAVRAKCELEASAELMRISRRIRNLMCHLHSLCIV